MSGLKLIIELREMFRVDLVAVNLWSIKRFLMILVERRIFCLLNLRIKKKN